MADLINDMSIRWKLVVIALLTSVIAQLLAGAIMVIYDAHAFRRDKSREVLAEAAILASSVTAALAFDDAKAAGDHLDALKANPEITAAAVYGADGKVFSAYARPGVPVPSGAGTVGQFFGINDFTVVMPVTQGTDRLGTIYLRAATEPISTRALRYAGILFLAALGSLVIAVPIAIRLNAAIANPIRAIAGAAARITTGDLSQDIAATRRTDEIGLLTEAFRQMVMSLREMTGTLERRVVQRTAQLEAANKELEAFSYSVSHDLRAPLRAIDGFARIIEEDYADHIDGEGKRLLSVVRANSRKMGMLIDDLLAFSRIGRQSINHTRIDMTALVREVWAEVEAERSSGGVDFTLAALPEAEGDRALLKQVWANLLSNAAKYSSARDHPVVAVSGERGERDIVYRVEDNGAGFDMQYYGKLFGVFQRLHSASQFSGTGVGLAIVQRIVVRHGGRVWAESEIDKGARFFFSLPQAKMR